MKAIKSKYNYAIRDTNKKTDTNINRAFMNNVSNPSFIKIGLTVFDVNIF